MLGDERRMCFESWKHLLVFFLGGGVKWERKKMVKVETYRLPTTGYFTPFPLSVFPESNLCISHLRYLGHYVYLALVTVFFAFRGLRFSTFVFLSIGLLCYHDQAHRPYFLLYFADFFLYFKIFLF